MVVQVPLKKFTFDDFAVSIEAGKSGAVREFTARRGSELEDAGPETSALGTDTVRLSQQDGGRFFQRSSGVINASCLSIIGMIEPGRTVRLYRQIH